MPKVQLQYSEEERTLQQIRELLAAASGNLKQDDDVIFEGRKYVLPEREESKRTAGIHLIEMADEEEERQRFSREYKYRPWDGAVATQRVLVKAYGHMHQRNSLFQMAETREVQVGPDELISVPWGEFDVPGLDGVVFVSMAASGDNGPVYLLSATGPRRFRDEINGVFNLVQEELEESSIYRGKAFNGAENPDFLDLGKFDPSKVVYSEEVLTELDANVWCLIRYPEQNRELGLPLKRAVVFEGPYGTGKTLGAKLTAKVAVDNGWTFIFVRPGIDDLRVAFQTAKLYAPCVVHVEDVETLGGYGGSRDHMSRVLDMFDGIDTKDSDVICVATTNHKEEIHAGMLRPGRIDGVIHIGALDAAGIRRLVEVSVLPGQLEEEMDWAAIAVAMDGYMPAFAKEAINRAQRYMLRRNKGKIGPLATSDFVHAARGLRTQFELQQSAKDKPEDKGLDGYVREMLDEIVTAASDGIREELPDMDSAASEIVDQVQGNTQSDMRELLNETSVYDQNGEYSGNLSV